MLSNHQKSLIRASFETVHPGAGDFAHLFYDNLFEMVPEVRDLFPENMDAQAIKLQSMLITALGELNRLEVLVEPLKELGVRHLDFATEEEHYDAVGDALLQTLAEIVPDWSDEHHMAWVSLYSTIASVMIDGTREYLARQTPPETRASA